MQDRKYSPFTVRKEGICPERTVVIGEKFPNVGKYAGGYVEVYAEWYAREDARVNVRVNVRGDASEEAGNHQEESRPRKMVTNGKEKSSEVTR